MIFICIGIKITFFGRTILHSSPIFIINAGLLRCIIDVGLGVILYLVRLYYLQCKRAYQIVLSIISFIIIFYILKHDNTIYSFLIVFPFCIVFLSLYSKKGMFYLILEKIYVKNISECSYMLYLSHIDVIYLFYYCVHNKIIFDSLDLTDKILITLFVVLLSVLQSFLLIKVKNIIFNKVIKF